MLTNVVIWLFYYLFLQLILFLAECFDGSRPCGLDNGNIVTIVIIEELLTNGKCGDRL